MRQKRQSVTPCDASVAVMADVDGLLGDLARWTGEDRAATAAAARVRERWLRQQATEDAHFAGVILDLSEQGIGVSMATVSGATLRGRIATVAADFCLVRHDDGRATLVGFAAVVSLRPDPGHRRADAGADRGAPVAATLADVLAGLAAERPRVRLGLTAGGAPVVGELRAVGADVLTVRLDGDPPATVYLRLAAVAEVTLLG